MCHLIHYCSICHIGIRHQISRNHSASKTFTHISIEPIANAFRLNVLLILTATSIISSFAGDNRYLTVFKKQMVEVPCDDSSQMDLCVESIAAITSLLDRDPLTDEEKNASILTTIDRQHNTPRLPYSFTIGGDRSKKKFNVPLKLNSNNAFTASRASLPIYEYRDNILDAINKNQVVVISGETGSGKTTQVPQYILEQYAEENKPCRIICTQPRRLAATSIADRVSQERIDRVGNSVGYQIRLDSCVSANTNLIFTTSGYLLRCLMGSKAGEIFSSVTHLLLDEVHEREKITDFLLIAIRDGLKLNPNVKIILMSATLDSDVFSKYFDNCPVIDVPGRTYAVDVVYLDEVLCMTEYKTKRMQQYMDQNEGPKKLRQNSAQPNVAMTNGHDNGTQLANGSNYTGIGNHQGTETHESNTPAVAAVATDARFSPDDVQFFDECLEQCLTGGEDVTFEQIYYLITDEDMPVDFMHTFTTRTALSIAAEKGFVNVLATLLEFGANAALPDSCGMTPLAYAIRNNHDECVQLLQSYVEDDRLDAEAARTEIDSEAAGGKAIAPVVAQASFEEEYKNAYRQFVLAAYQMTTHRPNDLDHELLFHVINYVHSHQPTDGSILVFLPGYDDIMKQREFIETNMTADNSYQLFVLHSGLNATKNSDQRRVFQRLPRGQRKIILSTNIAETSLTIDDVVYVIDSGRVKQQTYDSISDTTCLTSTWISQACAKQRAGRAGRTRNGHCYRMYALDHYETFEKYTLPEILRVPLTDICLNAKILADNISIEDFLLKALQPPPVLSIRQSINLLKKIDALDADENITYLGVHLADLPVDAQLGKCIIYGILLGCLEPIVTIVSALSVKDPFNLPMGDEGHRIQQIKKNFADGSLSDHIMLLHTYGEWLRKKHSKSERQFCHDKMISNGNMEMIHGVRKLIMGHLQMVGIYSNDPNGRMPRSLNVNSDKRAVIMACLTAGFYPNVCRLDGRTNRISSKYDRKLLPHLSSVLRNRTSSNQLDPALLDSRAEFMIHGEKSRVSQFSLIRNISMVASINIAVFGGAINLPETNVWTLKIDSWNAEPEIGVFSVGASSDEEDEADEDDGYQKQESTFLIDDWIRFKMDKNEADLVLQLRQKFNAVMAKFLKHPTKFEWNSADARTLAALLKVIETETQLQMTDQETEANDDAPDSDAGNADERKTNGCALNSAAYSNALQPEHRRGGARGAVNGNKKSNRNGGKKRKDKQKGKPKKDNKNEMQRTNGGVLAADILPQSTRAPAFNSVNANQHQQHQPNNKLSSGGGHPSNSFRSPTTNSASTSSTYQNSAGAHPNNRNAAYNGLAAPTTALSATQMNLMQGLLSKSATMQMQSASAGASNGVGSYGRQHTPSMQRHLPCTKYYVLTIPDCGKLIKTVYSNRWLFNKPISEIREIEILFPNAAIIIFFYVQDQSAIFGAGQFMSTNRNSSYNLVCQTMHAGYALKPVK